MGRSAIRSIKNDGATGQRKKLDDIFSHLDTIHEHDRQADGRTLADRKDRVYTYIASHDKQTLMCISGKGNNKLKIYVDVQLAEQVDFGS